MSILLIYRNIDHVYYDKYSEIVLVNERVIILLNSLKLNVNYVVCLSIFSHFEKHGKIQDLNHLAGNYLLFIAENLPGGVSCI